MIPLLVPLRPRVEAAVKLFQTAIDKGQLTNFGEIHRRLVNRLDYITGGFCLPIATGTASIEIALALQGFSHGERIGLPDFTHAGTLLAIQRAGLEPVLFGVDPKTWCLKLDEIEEAFTAGEIEGVVVVAPFGYHVDVVAWEELQDRTGIGVVYDFAGRFGSWPQTLSPIAYSFHATKNFGVGEGGMVMFQSENQRRDAQRLINFDTLPNREIGSINGANYKIDELKAAFLLAGLSPAALEEVQERIANKRRLMAYYREMIPGVFTPHAPSYEYSGDGHFPSLIVLGNLPASDLEEASEKVGITFKRYYPLLSMMEGLQHVACMSVSPPEMNNCCALPCDVDMLQAKRVVEVIKRYL